jgi:NTP pyrophosphatase (non-canonical NTP hydrolase)
MDLKISQMMQMQKELFALHKEKWPPMEPEFGKDYILYMIEEIGEVISAIKKKGSTAIMEEPSVRHAFLSEMAGVMMYYYDVLLRYHVTSDEISNIYLNKHNCNLNRDYDKEYREKYNG